MEEALGTVGGKASAAECGWPLGPSRAPATLPRGELAARVGQGGSRVVRGRFGWAGALQSCHPHHGRPSRRQNTGLGLNRLALTVAAPLGRHQLRDWLGGEFSSGW